MVLIVFFLFLFQVSAATMYLQIANCRDLGSGIRGISFLTIRVCKLNSFHRQLGSFANFCSFENLKLIRETGYKVFLEAIATVKNLFIFTTVKKNKRLSFPVDAPITYTCLLYMLVRKYNFCLY